MSLFVSNLSQVMKDVYAFYLKTNFLASRKEVSSPHCTVLCELLCAHICFLEVSLNKFSVVLHILNISVCHMQS